MPFLTAEQAAAIAGSEVRLATLVEMRFRSGTMRLWNGFGTVDVAGAAWTGAGVLGSINGLSQTRKISADKITLRLAGVDPQVIALAVRDTDDALGQPAFVWFQLFDEMWQPLGARIPAFWGLMHRPTVERTAAPPDGGQGGAPGAVRSVEIEVENPFAGRASSPSRHFTDQDQQERHPGDRFFRFVSAQTTNVVTWPDY